GAPLAPRMTVVLAGWVVPGASGVAGPGSVGLGSSRCGPSAAVSLSGGAAARSAAAFWLAAPLPAGEVRARAAAPWSAAAVVTAGRAFALAAPRVFLDLAGGLAFGGAPAAEGGGRPADGSSARGAEAAPRGVGAAWPGPAGARPSTCWEGAPSPGAADGAAG